MLFLDCCLLLCFVVTTLAPNIKTKDSSKNKTSQSELATTARSSNLITENPSIRENTDQLNGDSSGDYFTPASARLWSNATVRILKPDKTKNEKKFIIASSAILVWSNSTEQYVKVENVQNSFEKKVVKDETKTFLAIKIAIISVAATGWLCCCTACYLFLRQRRKNKSSTSEKRSKGVSRLYETVGPAHAPSRYSTGDHTNGINSLIGLGIADPNEESQATPSRKPDSAIAKGSNDLSLSNCIERSTSLSSVFLGDLRNDDSQSGECLFSSDFENRQDINEVRDPETDDVNCPGKGDVSNPAKDDVIGPSSSTMGN